jgi:UDP-N-acetylglucosamine 2-epimerase
VALCYGTRPQIIKASRLTRELATRFAVFRIDTGQHYDYELQRIFYDQLGVRAPDRFLEVGSGSLAGQTAAVLTRSADALGDVGPAAVVVIGDTNSTLGCALAAAQLRIPVVHVEAGLRARDRSMAEDLNRRVVDTLAGLLCAPSRRAERQLLDERVGGRVVFTGDVAHDVLREAIARLDGVPEPDEWPIRRSEPYLFATLHRAELTDHRERLAEVVAALGALDHPVVWPVHPRTGDRLAAFGLEPRDGRVHLKTPLGYLETLAAIRRSAAVITDSGGIQREAYWLGVPCVTVRDETEWTETVEVGANRLVPPATARAELAPALAGQVARRSAGWATNLYGDGTAASQVARAVGDLVG